MIFKVNYLIKFWEKVQFEVEYPYNKIIGKLGNEESYKVIHLEKGNVRMFFSLGVFFFISYVLYGFCKKYYGGWA